LFRDVTSVAEAFLLRHCLATYLGFQQICHNMKGEKCADRYTQAAPNGYVTALQTDVRSCLSLTREAAAKKTHTIMKE
jgi:hypothetical protein